ncbi:ribonuclease H-like domain-containing protein [Tanacetum coccineum]|uniref:Ribonuclease H-like domain-containing protein n=1 Tax=Tanacetum coccineum TaxID=301880 RepID=A0ABQ5E4T4_9ASTR
MEGTDRLNELKDEMLVNNIRSRLDCTTKELIKTMATISKCRKNLLTQLSHLIFIDGGDDVLDVELCLFDKGVGQGFTFEDEMFFNTSCITRMTLSFFRFNPPNVAISWERLECLCLWHVTLDEDMIANILSGSPCLESLKLKDCYHCIKINAPYISSLTIKRSLVLRELVLLDVSSLVEANLDYSIKLRYVIFEKEVFRGLLKSLGHVKHITFGNHCSETVLFSPTVQLTVSAVVPWKQMANLS